MSDPVVIIGGGLSGLTCACELHSAGRSFLLLEGSDDVGGRVRTDEVDGFLLDRGFQVLLTAYPEAQRQLNYDALQLCSFAPGSLIRTDGKFVQLSDPWRSPQKILQTAFAPVGSLLDKIKIGLLRRSASRGTLDGVFDRIDRTSEDELRERGFSRRMIETFFRPFLGGVYLDQDLQTSCRMLYFVFRMFSQGDTALPALGMGQISRQLASRLPEETVRRNTRVASVEPGQVILQSGEVISGCDIVVATEQSAATRLLPQLKPSRPPRFVHCVYFAAAEPPVKDRMLVLNGTGQGLVNNLCVPSQIAPNYAPKGQALISATVLAAEVQTETLHDKVKTELREWFGREVDSWRHLRTLHIPEALPNQSPPAFQPAVQPSKLQDHLFICGDYRVNGSINGAMQSGRLVAADILDRA